MRALTRNHNNTKAEAQYGLCLELEVDGAFGNGSAYGTHLRIDPTAGLVTVWMIQEAGGYPGEGYLSGSIYENLVTEWRPD